MIRNWVVAAGVSAVACAGATAPPVADVPPPPRLRGLDFAADLEVAESPTSLGGQVRVTNRGSTPETLVFADDCTVRLRVYEVRGPRVAPVWEGPESCRQEPVVLAIAPGESATLAIPATSAAEILGGHLPDDAYRVTVWLAPDERIIEIEAGQVELTAPR